MTHENYKELLAANALSALDAADARALNTHLESCADCQSEMIELEGAAALLAFEAQPIKPSAEVRARILTTLRAESPAGDRVSLDVSQNASNLLAFERPPRNIWASPGSFGAFAATVVFVALIIALVLLWQK